VDANVALGQVFIGLWRFSSVSIFSSFLYIHSFIHSFIRLFTHSSQALYNIDN
jgi:hypothetical protein